MKNYREYERIQDPCCGMCKHYKRKAKKNGVYSDLCTYQNKAVRKVDELFGICDNIEIIREFIDV